MYSCLSYLACKSHYFCATFNSHLWPVWCYNIFSHCLIKVTVFGKKILLDINLIFVGYKLCLDLLYNSWLKKFNKMQLYADIYLLLNYSTYFGCPLHPSSGVYKTVVAASGMDRTIWGASFKRGSGTDCTVWGASFFKRGSGTDHTIWGASSFKRGSGTDRTIWGASFFKLGSGTDCTVWGASFLKCGHVRRSMLPR